IRGRTDEVAANAIIDRPAAAAPAAAASTPHVGDRTVAGIACRGREGHTAARADTRGGRRRLLAERRPGLVGAGCERAGRSAGAAVRISCGEAQRVRIAAI